MKKRYLNSFLFLLSLLLVFQLVFPSLHVSASTVNNNLLPPSNLSFQLITPSDVRLSWSSVYGATGYNIYGIIDGQLIQLATTTSTSYTFNDLPEGSYTYVMSTLSIDGESGPCAPVTVDISYPIMNAPTNLTNKLQNGNDIILSWTASQYAQTYNLYQITQDGQKTLINSTNKSTYTITNALAGNYIYSASAVNSLYGESSLSTSTEVQVVFPTMTAPSNLTYSVTNGNDISLIWSAVSYANSYKVYQLIDGEKILISTVTGTKTIYSNMPAGNYVYEINSYSDRFGESENGSQIALTLDTTTMEAPSNFTYTIKNGNDITLNWGSIPYSTNYKVYQIVEGQKILKSTLTGTTVTYSNMSGGDYSYEVHSYNDRFGESVEGSQVSFTLVLPIMEAPDNLAYTIKNGNDITLNWASTPYTTNYKVYQIVNGQKVLKTTLTGTTVTYSNVSGGDYSYEVYSYSTRFGESQAGSSVTFTLELPVMQPPANVVKTIKNTSDFTLSWDSSPYATSYKVYQILNGQKVLKSTVTGTTVAYTKMTPGEYNFEIHSFSSRFGESVDSSKITFTLNGQSLEAPTNLSNTITNGNDITLKWTAAINAASYNIYQIINEQPVLQKIVTSTQVTFTNMPAGDYDYIVHSSSTVLGESPVGAEIGFSLVHPTMTAPENLAYKLLKGNDVVLTWSAVAYSNSYRIYELIDGQSVLKTTVTSTTATLTNTAEGNHTYIVNSVSSRFGESQDGSQVSFELVFPTMETPDNFTNSIANGNDITLRWNASNYATAYKIYQIIDEQKILVKTVTSTSNSFTNMPEGDYTYEIHSYSDRFGESLEGSQTNLTLVFPIMQSPTNLTNSIANGNDIVLRWNPSSYAKSYKIYEIIDGQKNLIKTVTSTSTSFTNMSEGDYSYEIHSYSDRFDESPEGTTIDFTLIWPVVEPPTLGKDIFNVNNITLSWNRVTWANEYRIYEIIGDTQQLVYKGTALSYKIYNLSEGTHIYQMTAYSTRFGESAPSNQLTETIVYPVMESPAANLSLLSETSARISWSFVTYANGYNVYEIIDNTPVLLVENLNNLSYTVMNLSYADHKYYVTSFSNSFGESEPSNTVLAKLIVDITPPVTSANAPTSWTNESPIDILLSPYDDETGVANTYYSINDGTFTEGTSLTVNQEGINKVSFYSVDNVGNIEKTQTVYVKIDKTAPITTSDAPTGWKNHTVFIDLLSIDQSGVARVFYSINGSDYINNISVMVRDEGINNLSYYAVDAAGNIEPMNTVEVKVDKTAPVTTSNAPAGWSKGDVTINLASIDTLSGVAKTFYSVDGSNYLEGTSFTIQEEGIHQISFYSVDIAGNIEAANTAEVKIDKTSPMTTSNAPANWSKGDVPINLASIDTQSGVARTFYSVDGSNYLEGTSFIIQEEGIHQISFYSVDIAGNIETTNTAEVKIDKTAPIITMDLKDEYDFGTMLQLTYIAQDNLSGVIEEEMLVFAPNETTGKLVPNGTNIQLDKSGIYTVIITATDATGLKTTIQKEFTVKEAYIVANIEVTPKVIKGNKGIFTVRVTLPSGYSNKGFDLDTVTLNGVSALNSNKGYYNQAKLGQFKFERSDFTWTSPEVVVEFRGYINGQLVVGKTTVKVQK